MMAASSINNCVKLCLIEKGKIVNGFSIHSKDHFYVPFQFSSSKYLTELPLVSFEHDVVDLDILPSPLKKGNYFLKQSGHILLAACSGSKKKCWRNVKKMTGDVKVVESYSPEVDVGDIEHTVACLRTFAKESRIEKIHVEYKPSETDWPKCDSGFTGYECNPDFVFKHFLLFEKDTCRAFTNQLLEVSSMSWQPYKDPNPSQRNNKNRIISTTPCPLLFKSSPDGDYQFVPKANIIAGWAENDGCRYLTHLHGFKSHGENNSCQASRDMQTILLPRHI